jgi:hypothetical protein
VKQGILHTEVTVRQSAMDYFAGAFSTDPAVLPIAFRAIKQYGAADALEHYEWMGALAQTDESFGLILAALRGLDEFAIEFDDYRKGLEQALQSACASLLQRHDEEIRALDVLDAMVYPSLHERVRLFGLEPLALWNELERFCETIEECQYLTHEQQSSAWNLVDALAYYRDSLASKVLDALRKLTNYWREILAAMAAGAMRLEPAARLLIPRLQEVDEAMVDVCSTSLAKIRSDSVVRALASDFPIANDSFRFSVASILEDIHSNVSVEACLDFLEEDLSEEVEAKLLEALLQNFAANALELGRQFVLRMPRSPHAGDVRHRLVVAALLMNREFPELEYWKQADLEEETEGMNVEWDHERDD